MTSVDPDAGGAEPGDDATFAVGTASFTVPMRYGTGDAAGMMNPLGVAIGGRHGVAKLDGSSAVFEPLAYELGRRLGVNVPRTVRRTIDGQAASVQQRVPGTSFQNLADDERAWVRANDDYATMAIFDWLVGNADRHEGNSVYDPEGRRLHAIDNGQMGGYFTLRPAYRLRHGEIVDVDPEGHIDWNLREAAAGTTVPAALKDAILTADLDEHRAIIVEALRHDRLVDAIAARRRVEPAWYGAFDRDVGAIAEHLTQHYLDRLKTLIVLFRDASVRRIGALYGRLYRSA